MPVQFDMSKPIPDVQAKPDSRKIAIDRVGVKGVTYPLTLRTREGGELSTVARFDMYVALPHHQKGTHMSRFVEALNDHDEPLQPDAIPELAETVRERLDAEEAHVRAEFTYFIRKHAPVTGEPGMIDYIVSFEGVARADGRNDLVLTVSAPATSLCPCSKEISEYGAHNQRCRVTASVRFDGTLWIEDLAEHLEQAASMEVYAVLKRPDEKFVTEKAYENPKFVEDIIRDLALRLEGDERVLWYSIESENFESIHSHNAYARIEHDKRSS